MRLDKQLQWRIILTANALYYALSNREHMVLIMLMSASMCLLSEKVTVTPKIGIQ